MLLSWIITAYCCALFAMLPPTPAAVFPISQDLIGYGIIGQKYVF